MGHNKLLPPGEDRKMVARIMDLELLCNSASQMLVNHIKPSSSGLRQAFNTSITSMGQPEECLRTGLTNGSATAQGQIN